MRLRSLLLALLVAIAAVTAWLLRVPDAAPAASGLGAEAGAATASEAGAMAPHAAQRAGRMAAATEPAPVVVRGPGAAPAADDPEPRQGLRLRLFDEAGEPLAGIGLTATASDGRVHILTTDRDGRASSALELPAGMVQLAIARRSDQEPPWLLQPTDLLLPIVPAPGVDARGHLGVQASPPPVRVSILVLGPDGAPVPGAEVRMQGANSLRSDQNGEAWLAIHATGSRDFEQHAWAWHPQRGLVSPVTNLVARGLPPGGPSRHPSSGAGRGHPLPCGRYHRQGDRRSRPQRHPVPGSGARLDAPGLGRIAPPGPHRSRRRGRAPRPGPWTL